MPSHTPASALVKLFFALRGAPWIFDQWQELTGVTHGLEPASDAELPEGLTRRELEEIMSYFSQYEAKPTEDAKIKFASHAKKKGKDPIPGRGFWTSWVNERYTDKWKVNSRIAKILSSLGLHPEQIMEENKETAPPPSSSYLPVALDIIGRELFGVEALDSNGRLFAKLRDPTLILAQRTWFMEVKGIGRKKKKVDKSREKAEDSLKGTSRSAFSISGLF
jgi:TATA-binding protein-associated factor